MIRKIDSFTTAGGSVEYRKLEAGRREGYQLILRQRIGPADNRINISCPSEAAAIKLFNELKKDYII